MIKKLLHQPFFIKLFNWEYWPFHVVYGPIYIYWIFLCIRARSFFFFNTSNPGIHNGGFLMESKKEIYDLIPAEYYPGTVLFEKDTAAENILREIRNREWHFPLIAKPDIGMKGLSVVKVNNETELLQYAGSSKVNFLVQQFIPYEKEAGIFYCRFPGEERGFISGIVEKEFLEVEGNGQATIMELLLQEKRFILQIPVLQKTYGRKLHTVLPKGVKHMLVPYGNHARGAKFIDVSDRIDEQLTNTIDKVCRQVEGFYFGRMDVRYNSWQELTAGKNFSIIELNGAGSEPTHIYDPKHSVFFAWKEIIRHWNILAKISRINHQRYKMPYMKTSSGLDMFRQNKSYVKNIKMITV